MVEVFSDQPPLLGNQSSEGIPGWDQSPCLLFLSKGLCKTTFVSRVFQTAEAKVYKDAANFRCGLVSYPELVGLSFYKFLKFLLIFCNTL